MGTPYMGEIRMFAGTYAPQGWWQCDGSLLPISEYDALFALIGTAFGGDGQSTFAVPDLRGRVPLHRSQAIAFAQSGGAESVTLAIPQLPVHNHAFNATTALANQPTPGGNTPAQSGTVQLYTEDSASAPLDPQALMPSDGGYQPHENMHPFQVMTYIIALYGIYPPPT